MWVYNVIVYCKSFYLKDMHTIVQQDSYFTTMHDWLCHLAIFLYYYICKRWPSDKANHAWLSNSYPVELLCACLLSKRIYNKQLHCTHTSWPYLISELLVADLFTMLLLLGLAIFLHPRCFCLVYILLIVHMCPLFFNKIASVK